ncbi:TonB-linked SusC/RagA family outer membrane protein [Chitinophaga dinghuensis]|uniref:TonB-linked SusC/RagA family outer membrane protein n=1 Tax=Chitinophaga dinghuensis TaxID=1539050 RepID=A0A327WDR5_9BACT|nr:SusC/RagA family TonB-linked outer membrane protein [Chitinophaga dinghuensis]RAJ87711.1 TonB-linked SusC/RagA family outer membrane protein [Chitinophaga dinghuensis]
MRVKPCPLKWFLSFGLILTLLLAGSLTSVGSTVRHIQEPLLPIVVSIQAKDKNLEEVMSEISTKTGLNFHYDNSDLNLKKKVTLNCIKVPIDEVLTQLSDQTGLKFTRKNNKIIVGAESDHAPSLSVELDSKVSLDRDITGTIRDNKGTPLPGVTIQIKNSNKGTQSNADAAFNIKAAPGDVLVVSSVGFFTKEVMVGASPEVNITLQENIRALGELVVTAMGIQKKSKELPYATQQLGGDDVSLVKDVNVMNTLAGKTAGVTICRNASGIGGSVRVVLRGNKSTRENQPLYIVDGVPYANFTPSQPNDVWGQSNNTIGAGGRDGGDGISNINPDDIESISILKGASAAALYGSQAANGVILITTRKGKAGRSKMDFSSDFTIETPSLLPDLQYRYGQTDPPGRDNVGSLQPGSPGSWGDPIHTPDIVKHFYNTGYTWTNGISFSGGTETAQSYLSYANTTNKGILPTNSLDRHAINFRETLKLLNNRLIMDATVSFLAQATHNRSSSGLYYSPISGLYLFPRGQDFDYYSNNFEYLDKDRNLYLQNWWNIRNDRKWIGQDDQQNPMWALKRDIRLDSRYRGMSTICLTYQLNNWLSVQSRGSFDKSLDQYELNAYAGTQVVLAASNGRYTLEKEFNTQLYADLLLNASGKVNNWMHLAGNIGGSITDVKAHERTYNGANPHADPGLMYPNKFAVSNIMSTAMDAQQSVEQKQLQALFGNVQLGIRNAFFLDITGRNDWSSTFAYTPTLNKGYFYYSAGASLILSDVVKMPKVIDFLRVRTSFAKVGNDIASYASNPAPFTMQTIAGVSRVVLNQRTPYPGVFLAPEDNQSLEAGFETRLFKNRLSLDVTWYKNNNYKQYMEVPAPVGSKYLTYYLNMGNIQNRGWEAMLTVAPVRNKKVNWTSTVNFAINQNKVIKLSNKEIPGADSTNSFVLTDFGVNMFGSFIQEGGSWGDIYGNKELVTNAKGQFVLDNSGNLKTNATPKRVGNPNPRFTLGWNNSIYYGDFSLSFLVDGHFGGKVMSVTQAVLDWYGVSEVTAKARDNGGVSINAVYEDGRPFTGKMSAEKYYSTVGGRAGVGQLYMYDATNIRLREVSLSYRLPLKWKWLRTARVGLMGRNLAFFYLKAPFDPEVSMGSGNGLQGVDVFGLPPVRSMGMNLKIGF